MPIDEVRPDAGTIVWRDPGTGERFETPVTGGHAKLQWKPDWAMRWVALGVDYEMAGKDLIDSVKLSGEIARAIGGEPPEGFNYELFLDEKGQKISKSKGNGLTIDEWLAYGTPESLSLFMYNKPREAKRLYFDVIPRHVDDYLTFLEKFPGQDAKTRLGNPVWHIHAGAPPAPELVTSGAPAGKAASLSFSMLLNLVAVANSEDAGVLWGFIRRYAPGVSPATHPRLDRLVGYAVRYYPRFRAPGEALPAAERGRARGAGGARRGACAPTKARPMPRRCRPSSTRSGAGISPTPPASRRAPTGAPASRRPGSRRSTRSCSARSAARASAPSSRSTASPRPAP